MANILTPTAMWGNFDDSLPTNPTVLSSYEEDGVRFERVSFDGRATAEGRVRIYAEFACNSKDPEEEAVLIMPDSADSVDRELLKFFVSRGYSALMVDYRGDWEGAENFTRYPADVGYANLRYCGRAKDFVDESADKTCWYEWVAVGIYARKYLTERTGGGNIAAVGLRDGGEIVWKLGAVRKFSCIIPVCAAGWKAYTGFSKYVADEPGMDDERYRFIAGIDSQAYAALVKCPVLMLCSTNDTRFDYDRAHDTFSRINPDYIAKSVIAYSVSCHSAIDADSVHDMFMFLDNRLKNRQVFIPKLAEVKIAFDGDDNLIAEVNCDEAGIAENISLYFAEDCVDSVLREWTSCRAASSKNTFMLDIYERTSTLFALACVKYTNGFTAWSKIVVKKVSGRFRNMQTRSAVIYSDRFGINGFTSADEADKFGIFRVGCGMPRLVAKAKGVRGIYAEGGLSTYRINSPRFAPLESSILKLDIFCDDTRTVTIIMHDMAANEKYSFEAHVIGGVWQTLIAQSKDFKNAYSIALSDFSGQFRLSILCDGEYAVNNVMWL